MGKSASVKIQKEKPIKKMSRSISVQEQTKCVAHDMQTVAIHYTQNKCIKYY